MEIKETNRRVDVENTIVYNCLVINILKFKFMGSLFY